MPFRGGRGSDGQRAVGTFSVRALNSRFVSGSYLLTGQRKNLRRIVTARPFRPTTGQWGAWEAAARYSGFQSESDLFASGLATGAGRAGQVTLGLNWFPNEFMRALIDYGRVGFSEGLAVEDKVMKNENVILVQLQLEF